MPGGPLRTRAPLFWCRIVGPSGPVCVVVLPAASLPHQSFTSQRIWPRVFSLPSLSLLQFVLTLSFREMNLAWGLE